MGRGRETENTRERKSEKEQAVAITCTLRILPYSIACLTGLLKEKGINQSNRNGEGGEEGKEWNEREREMADARIRARQSGALRYFSFVLTSYLPLSNSLWVGNSWSSL